MLLSIGMMIKNEEKHLRNCLQRLTPLLEKIDSELIIIDTGSSDDSVKISKCFTEKVFLHAWNDNFSEMRNKVISYCSGEWIMIIDGDEILQNPDEIINFIKSKESRKFNTALLMVKNLTDEKDLSNFSLISSPRLFRRDKDFHYEGAIHNQPVFKEPTAKLGSSLIHYGYISSDLDLMERKFIRTVNLLKKELEKDPKNFYYWYQLSVSYAMHKEYEKALDYCMKSYEIIKGSGLSSDQNISIYMQLANLYLVNNDYKHTIDICNEGIKLREDILDLYFCLGKAQMMTNDYEGTIKNYKKYLHIYENMSEFSSTNLSLYTLGKYEYAYYDLAISLKETEEYEEALEYCKKISVEELVKSNLNNVIFLCLKTNSYDYLYEYYYSYVTKFNIQKIFENFVEFYQKELSYEEKIETVKTLKNIDSLYGVLNKIRCSIYEKDELSSGINSYLDLNADFNELDDYYGDILYYFILNRLDISKFLNNVRELDFNRFFVFLSEKYDSLGQEIFSYLQEVKFNKKISSLRIKKALERYCIILAQFSENDFVKIFDLYTKDGIEYINKIYSQDTILQEDIFELKNEEEGFLLYMSKAFSIKDTDKKSYVSYLRKALQICPYMKTGIEYLLSQFNKEENKAYNEIEQYKIHVKNTIRDLINNNNLKEAKLIISEYEQIVKDDIEIVLFKSQIALNEAN